MNSSVQDGLFLANRFRRLVATGIDAVIVPLVAGFLVMVTGVVEHAEDFADNWWMLHVLLIAVGSYLTLNGYLLWKSGQTIGKRVMGIAIVCNQPAVDGSLVRLPVPLWKLVFIRALFFPFLFALVVPWFTLIPIVDQVFILGRRRRCLHDLVTGTLVVALPKTH